MTKTVPDAAQGAQVDPDDLLELLQDWQIHLKARNVSHATIDSYLRVSRTFYAFLQSNGLPPRARHITRDNVETYLASMFERQARNRSGLIRPATVAKHYRSLQQLFRWLVDDGEIERSPMERMRPPSVPEQPVPVIPDKDLPPSSPLAAATPSRTGETWPSSGSSSTPE